MNDNEIINKLTNVVDDLTSIIKSYSSRESKMPQEISFDEISNPFGSKEPKEIEVIEKIVEVPVEVEVIKEVIKEVPVEVEVIKEVIKIIVVDKDGYELPDFNIKEVKSPRPKEVIKSTSVKKKEMPKAEDNIKKIVTDYHEFPEELFHLNGFIMKKFKGKLIYKPDYELTPNQEYFGVDGQWNVVVSYDKDKDQYKTQHPEPQFNAQLLYKEKQ